MKLKHLAALFSAASVAVAGAGCGASTPSSTSKGSITIYNGQHAQTTQALVAAFEKQTGIKVEQRDGGEGEFLQQIEQEGSKSKADVFFAENSPELVALEQKDMLAPVTPATLAAVPSQYNSASGDWVGVSARVNVMVYNTDKIQAADLPKSILDLADPKWKGKLALAPTETDFQPVIAAVDKASGDAATLTWLKGLKANTADHVEPDNETAVSDVNSGQGSISIMDHYYWYRLQKEDGAAHSKIAYFSAQDPGYVVDVSGAAILKSSKHQAEAQQFLQFLVSPAGQQVMAASDSFEYPLIATVAPPAGLEPFSQLTPYSITLADLGNGSAPSKLEQEAQLT